MTSPENHFQQLVGRAPTPTEVAQLYHVKDALKVRDDDPIWAVLIAFGHYGAYYESIPADIQRVAEQISRMVQDLENKTLNQERWLSGWRLAVVVGCLATIAAYFGWVARGAGLHADVQLLRLDSDMNLPTCFHGAGRVESRGDKEICYPVGADGRVFGYVLRERPQGDR